MKGLMIQGTASGVGKSIISIALCRLFYREGYQVAPFKAQNITRHLYTLSNNEKIAKSQVIQAKAAHAASNVYMNPTSLAIDKGRTDMFVLGKRVETLKKQMEPTEKYDLWLQAVETSLHVLKKQYEFLVLEGAGSPVELNLKKTDVANMKAAELADVPVILVADIHRGGAFASIVGTLALLEREERKRVKGIIINKFHGDKALFQDGINLLETKTSLPVLGVIPFIEHTIEEEDSSDQPETFKTSLPTEQQLDMLATNIKQHLDWGKLIEITEQWDQL